MSRPGDLMGGRYRLTDRIAAGGMGEVWQARDEILGRAVAVKLLKEGLTDEEGFTERFRNEARLSAALAHGNIAQVYDYGEEGNLAYLVMEFVPGKPLSKILHERGPISAADTANLMGQAAAALHAAHRAGLIHRDVKPANMLVTSDGVVKLTDFGIARAVGSAAMTKTGEVMGTAQYLAPEAAMGRETTALTDVYSLAVVTYEMLGGRRPFNSDSAVALALAHVNEEPPPLPTEVPAPLRAVVHAGLRKDPAERPDSAQEFGRALRQAVSDSEQMGLNIWTPAPRPVAGGPAGPSGPNSWPSGPQSGPPSGPQSGPHSGGQPQQSGGQPQTSGGRPQNSGSNKLSRAQRKARTSGPQPATSGAQPAAGTHRSLRAGWIAVIGAVVAVAVIAIVVVVILSHGGGSPQVPTAPNTGPFNNGIVTYAPEGSS
ncbi:protein kinase domain-containing protein [Flexivirga oryzae]|uniref:non-specific serine/threonine protein kinase n=1 Tax=Flexivirga oryzae TaxID=1794944 RepID=A0A839N768_9MICO|nr:protein kinase [Flexivirga oryzae]MBB2893600.1 serine/threonine-protein kinase [Flexivirga oryzae]